MAAMKVKFIIVTAFFLFQERISGKFRYLALFFTSLRLWKSKMATNWKKYILNFFIGKILNSTNIEDVTKS